MGPGFLAGPFGITQVGAPTARQAAETDRKSIDRFATLGSTLMENAGRQAALITQHLFPSGPVAALVGSGNNGGDALVALRSLAAWGRRVCAVVVGRPGEDDDVLHGWAPPKLHFDAEHPKEMEDVACVLTGASVVLDGLLGTGLRGAPGPRHAAAIRALEGARTQVVALDTPSGVQGDDGTVPGVAVRADVTVAFGWPKLGTMLYPGRERCGRIVAVEIGFPRRDDPDPEWVRLLTPGWATDLLPDRPPQTHKNAVGALTVVAGSAMPGAAVLAARAAFRCGVGVVRVCASGRSSAPEILRSVPEILYVDASDERALGQAVEAGDALVIGPGLGAGEGAARQVAFALECLGRRPAVLDADALTVLADAERFSAAGGGARSAEGALVVTPHLGEMARLTGHSVARVRNSSVAVAREFAATRGFVTVLKGTPSLVADPAGRTVMTTLECPSSLAVAGMGDVLAGAIGAFLAQGVGGLEASALGLHVTGQAARTAALGHALMPSDVIASIPTVLSCRGRGATDLPFPFVTFDQHLPA